MINNLFLTSFKNSGTVDANIKLQITRSNKNLLKGWIHIPQLSPSWALFNAVLDWKMQLVWDKKWEEYKEKFLKEMSRTEPQRYLRHIALRLKEGNRIALACYCPDEEFCHRRLVKELVEKILKNEQL